MQVKGLKERYPLILSETAPSETQLRREFLARIEKGTQSLEIEWDPKIMKEMSNVNVLNIRLNIQGYKSVDDWARKYGYKIHQVKNALRRWRNRQHGFPNGEGLRILIELSRTVCYPVTPVLAPFYPDYGKNLKWLKRGGGR